MSAIGRSVKMVILLLVSTVVCSSLGNVLLNTYCPYKNDYLYPNCGNCCTDALRSCKTLCKGCPVWKNKTRCYVHKDNPNYWKYFTSKKCHVTCKLNTKQGRELDNEAFYFFSKMAGPDYLRQDDAQLIDN